MRHELRWLGSSMSSGLDILNTVVASGIEGCGGALPSPAGAAALLVLAGADAAGTLLLLLLMLLLPLLLPVASASPRVERRAPTSDAVRAERQATRGSISRSIVGLRSRRRFSPPGQRASGGSAARSERLTSCSRGARRSV